MLYKVLSSRINIQSNQIFSSSFDWITLRMIKFRKVNFTPRPPSTLVYKLKKSMQVSYFLDGGELPHSQSS